MPFDSDNDSFNYSVTFKLSIFCFRNFRLTAYKILAGKPENKLPLERTY
jgi:hypothetical protein